MSGRRAPGNEGGFSLVELIAAIAILGIISFVLAQSLILGFKTTDGTIANVSRSAAIQALEPFFTADVHSAEAVWVDPLSSTPCAPQPIVQLRWTEKSGAKTTVAYAFVPPTGGEQELVRVTCTGGGSPARRVLGHFTHDPAGPPPASVVCLSAPPTPPSCPAAPDVPGAPVPTSVTLTIQTDPSASPGSQINLTVRRRLP